MYNSGSLLPHLEFLSTPLQLLSFFSNKWQKKILCKRDDLFNAGGGGSKARMLQYILASKDFKDCDEVLTAGGPNSNFNRACGLMCALLNKTMTLVEYSENPIDYSKSLNNFICQLSGVRVVNCMKSEVAKTLDNLQQASAKEGRKIFRIYGGGKCLEGIYAYYEAVRELRNQYSGTIDSVYVACGTGTTLTGLCAGFQEFFPEAKINAISVARTWEEEKEVLYANMTELNRFMNTDYSFDNLKFHDQFLLGGYGKTDMAELDCIKECVCKEGMLIDPVYTGKAWLGMNRLCPKEKSEVVLFWNTGAIFNLLSYKDSFNFHQASLIEYTENNVKIVLEFLRKADYEFKDPISSRVDLADYAQRIFTQGQIIGIMEGEILTSAIFFYCNDFAAGNGYISLLCCLPEYRGHGFAGKLVMSALDYSKSRGMKKVYTDSVNPLAVRVYERAGFRTIKEEVVDKGVKKYLEIIL